MGYTFQGQLKVGKALESYIASILGAEEATMEQQRSGIDMVCKSGTTIETKLDVKSVKSGNFFAELTTGSRPGCMFTSSADIIIICLGEPGNYPVYVTNSSRFAGAMVEFNQKKLKLVQCRNSGGYGSTGMLVPVRIMGAFCDIIMSESQLIDYVNNYRLRFRAA